MTPDELMALGRRFMESRVFLTAAELDLFALLSKRPMTSAEIADELQVTLRGVTILLDAAAGLGLLDKKDGTYSCPADIAPFVSPDSPASIMAMIKLNIGGWKRWSALTDIVRSGFEQSRPAVFEGTTGEQEAFIGAMHVIASRLAPGIVAAIQPGDARSLLDIGGASGSYTLAFLKACPGMSATIFDLPPVIDIARRRLDGSEFMDRITLMPGDFYKDELPGGHDLALLSAIIHQNSPGQNVELYRNIYRALGAGGRLVIRDHVMREDHTAPAVGALFAVNMLVGTPGGSTYSFEEIKGTLESAGFSKIRLIQPDERMNGLIEGYKL